MPPQAGNNHPTSIPTGVYPCADGHFNIAAGGQDMFERLCRALGADEIAANPNYASGKLRLKHRDALNAEISEYTKTKNSAEWIDLFNEGGVPCGPIHTIDKMFDDPQVKHLGLAAPVTSPTHGEMHVVGQAVNMSRAPRDIRSATPELGEHTDEILADLGYDAAKIEELRAESAV